MIEYFSYLPWAASLIALLFAGLLAMRIKKISIVDKKVEEISTLIRNGALAYLNKQYR